MTSTNHSHKVQEQKAFSNTKHGWIEICECGAARTQIPSGYGIVTGEWQ